MTYERTRQIELRFRRAATLIEQRTINARQLANALDVSQPTAHRIVAELRRRGYQIRAVRERQGWRYELQGRPNEEIG
ncbi:MAG: HTH domain-containing protein [Thermomicrobiales bacterium]